MTGRTRSVAWGIMCAGLCLLLIMTGSCRRKARQEHAPSDRSFSTMIPRVAVEEVRGWMDEGKKITFIDARSPASWDVATIKLPGAIRVPPEGFEPYLAKVKKSGIFVAYCT